MAYKMVVCIKQVPDTHRITGEAMKEDGTVNRAALPAIMNPEDLNALEMALQVKDQHGGEIHVITMGPPRAADVLRECLFRGADRTILLTDRRCAAGDTRATSFVLAKTITKIGSVDIVFCGRQAIDGDTAQTGPQIAEKLGLAQFTYAEELEILDGRLRVRRSIEGGYEVLEGPLPALLTVTAAANIPRPPAAKRMMKFKKAKTPSEIIKEDDYMAPTLVREARLKGLLVEEWNADDIGCAEGDCGLKGSHTKVKKIESVKLVSKEHKKFEPVQGSIDELVRELTSDHILG